MTRRVPDTAVRIPRRALLPVAAVLAVVLGVALVAGLGAIARANEPRLVASPAQVKTQQTAAERGVERAYEQATEQVRKVRALNLAISQAQADQIATRALADLKALRRSAFISLGQIVGMPAAEAESYAAVTEQRFDQSPIAALPSAAPSPSPVLLAPRFYLIVSRMSELATQLADQATTALTAPPPSPSPRPPSPSPSPARP